MRTRRPGTNGNIAGVKPSRSERWRRSGSVSRSSGPGRHGPGPRVGEVVPDVEDAQAVAGEPAPGVVRGGGAQRVAAFAGGVVEVQDDVGHGVQVEVVVLRRQLDPPPADRALVLERQVPLVPEVQLEQP